MIVDHVWRPRPSSKGVSPLCEFMNCRRERAEHARAVAGYRYRGQGGGR